MALDATTRERIDKLVAPEHPVVVFIKGTPQAPQCGFSKAVVQILHLHGLEPGKYSSHNILEDTELRTIMKEYSEWPTFPQVYMKGEFVGGCDIMINLHQSGKLVEELKAAGITSTYTEE